MKRPAFQFYPKDWRCNQKLRRCSEAAKGAWIEILCFLHDSEEYGVARFPLRELVVAAGVQAKSAKELVGKGVLKGGDGDVEGYVYVPRHAGKDGEPVTLLKPSKGPMWYCSRFVRDEYLRLRRGESTRFDENRQPDRTPKPEPNTAPKSPIGERQGDGPAAALASATPLSSTVSRNDSGNAQPVEKSGANAPGKARLSTNSSSYEARIVAEGRRKGLEPRRGESLEAFEARVRHARAA